MWLLKNPMNYEVLVATNLFGDIISDLCAQMVGGLGFGCSGNIGEKLAVFEPTHGSAPKYAGQYKVNPIATILAAKMMLDWLGETEKARRAREAPSPRSSRKARCAPTTWAAAARPWRWPRPSPRSCSHGPRAPAAGRSRENAR